MGQHFPVRKEDNVASYTQMFENSSMGISIPLDYLLEISGIFG